MSWMCRMLQGSPPSARTGPRMRGVPTGGGGGKALGGVPRSARLVARGSRAAAAIDAAATPTPETPAVLLAASAAEAAPVRAPPCTHLLLLNQAVEQPYMACTPTLSRLLCFVC